MEKTKHITNRIIHILAGPVLVTILWQLLSWFNIFDGSLFPKPVDVMNALLRMFSSGNIFPDLRDTIFRMLTGYGAAILFGVGAGLLIGSIKPLYNALELMIDFFRSIPVTTLYPIFVLSFGIGHLSKIAMVFWSCIFVIMLNSAYGVIQSSDMRSKVAGLYGANRSQVFRWITFFDALPQTLIGLRVAISFSLIVEILCEMFMGSEFGLGQRITEAFTTYAMADLYALVILAGILGYTLNRVFVFFEKRLVPWVGA